MNSGKTWMLAACAAVLLPAGRALAADDAEVEQVVVTAQKRAENIQDVPLSIMAVTRTSLEAHGVSDVRGLERVVPGLRTDNVAQVAGFTLRIRGFGAFSNSAIDPSVAPYLDGAYVPRPGVILTGFLDVEAVEVLRGPQGTLFGRNATVGALSITTHAPEAAFGGRVAGEVGAYGTRKVEGVLNTPVSDALALRFAGIATHTDGFIRNILDGQSYGESETLAGRLSARWSPTETLTATLRADYARTTGDGVPWTQADASTASAAQLASFGARTGTQPSVLAYPLQRDVHQLVGDAYVTDRQYGVTTDVSWAVGEGYTLRLIGAYRDWRNREEDEDQVFTPLSLVGRTGAFNSESTSGELQLISPKDVLFDGRLDFVAGVYFFEEDYRIGEIIHLGASHCGVVTAVVAPALVAACNAGPMRGASTAVFTQNARSMAAYAQANFALTSTLEVGLGARETQDRKSGAFVQQVANPAAAVLRGPEAVALEFKDDRPSWRASLSWHATPDVMAFATYSTGYKSGGLNSSGSAAPLGARRAFDSETSSDWAVGLKSVTLDRRLLLNVTFYRTDLNGFQERSFDGVSQIIRNAGSIRAQGVEIEGQARPTRHLAIDFAAAYLDSKFTDNPGAPGLPGCNNTAASCPTVQNLLGRRATFSPKWQANLGVEYTTPSFGGGFQASIRADVAYTDRLYSTPDLNPQAVVDSFTLYGGRITLVSPDKSWALALFGENLTDEHYFHAKFPQLLDVVFGVRVPATGASLLRGFAAAPRTWGLRATKSF